MEPRIEILAEKKLIGKSIMTSFDNDRTFELWRSFMPVRKEIKNKVGTNLFSIQVYDSHLDFKDFRPTTIYEKWAAVEVSDQSEIPGGMLPFNLPGGLYAVFHYKGRPADFEPTFRYIFYEWMPGSIYQLDNRPHFEILGEKYKNDHPDSEEEIWVPVKAMSA